MFIPVFTTITYFLFLIEFSGITIIYFMVTKNLVTESISSLFKHEDLEILKHDGRKL